MESSLFPELPQPTARNLLRKQIVPAEKLRGTRQRVFVTLLKLGILQFRWHAYVRCKHPEDPDYLNRPVFNCPGLIPIMIDDPEQDYYCPKCGRPVTDIKWKLHFLQYGIQINQQGVKRYLQQALMELDVVRGRPTFTEQGNFLKLKTTDGEDSYLFLFDYVGPIQPNEMAILLVVSPYLKAKPVGLPHLNLLDFVSLPQAEVRRLWSEVRPVPEPTDAQLRSILVAFFTIDELRPLCNDLQIYFDDIRRDTRELTATALIDRVRSQGRRQELVQLVRKYRPHVNL